MTTYAFRVTPKIPGYGHRVWVENVDRATDKELYRALDRLSMWGGSDKTVQHEHGYEVSWELSDQNLLEAVRWLTGVLTDAP